MGYFKCVTALALLTSSTLGAGAAHPAKILSSDPVLFWNSVATTNLAIDQLKCIGSGPGADCSGVVGGAGELALEAYSFAGFEVRLRTKHVLEITGGVPEPGTWAMIILGFGAVGAALAAPLES